VDIHGGPLHHAKKGKKKKWPSESEKRPPLGLEENTSLDKRNSSLVGRGGRAGKRYREEAGLGGKLHGGRNLHPVNACNRDWSGKSNAIDHSDVAANPTTSAFRLSGGGGQSA